MNFSKWTPCLRGIQRAALASTIGAMLLASTAIAAPLHTMTLEGQLLTSGGTAVPDGNYTVTASFYKAKGDSKALFSQVLPVKTVAGGFVMTLGLKTPLPTGGFYSGDAAWVGISVDSDPELERIPVSHIAYAMRADVAGKLQCSGCVLSSHLDASVLKPYAKTVDLKFAKTDQACGKGQVVVGIDAAGKVACATDKDTKNTYTGKNFALSGQACKAGEVVVAIDADGKAKCAPDQKGQSSGKDFALSNQSCGSGLVMKGVDNAGKPICVKDSAPVAPADKLSAGQVTNLQANKLANGSQPWTTTKYDINNEWLRERGNDAHFKQYGGKRQMVFRTDGTAQYNTGIGAYPFVFQYGGDVKANSVMAINGAGQLWLKAYGWLHTAFAKAGKTCPTNQVVRGFTSGGDPICILDQKGASSGKDFALSSQSCGSGLVVKAIDSAGKVVCVADKVNTYKAGTGITISGTTISGNFSFLDGRYVNENQANSISGAMIKDSTVTSADVANNSLTGADIKDSSLTGSDVANSSLTGADVKDSSLTGSDIADNSLTGNDVANSSLTGADIKDSSLTGSDVATGSLTGSDIKDGSVTGTDIANESVTGSDVKNGSLTYSDTNVNSIQRRVASSCPSGQAIRAINSNGTVACENDVGESKATYAGSVSKGNWYRIAQSGNGYEVAGTFTVWDTSHENQAVFRVAVSSGYGSGMHFKLISSSRYSGILLDRVRVVEGSASQPHYVDIKVGQSATMYFKLDNNNHQHKWTPIKPKIVGTSDAVSGYSVRQFYLDRVANAGDYMERHTVYRGGMTRIRSDSGYVDVHSDSAKATLVTDRGYFYMNKQLRVDSGYVGSYNEDLRLATSGSTRIHVNNSTGNVGVGYTPDTTFKLKAAGNTYASGYSRADGGFQVDGKQVIDNNAGWHRAYNKTGFINATYGGGIYMADTTWLRIYNNKGLLTSGSIQGGHLRSTGTAQIDKTLSVTSTTTVGGTLNANNGIVVDGKTVIDNGANWHRAYNKTGFINSTYGGGIYMADTTWVRIYGSKSFLVDKNIYVGGSIGIGDSSPNYPLDVEKSSTSWLGTFQNTYGSDTVVHLSDNDHGIYVKTGRTDTTSGYIAHFRNQSGHAMTIDNNRRVGINTESPSYNLEVNGSFQADSIRVGSVTLASYIDTRVRNWVRGHCYLYLGWRDSCNGCTSSPSKWAFMRANGTCSASGSNSTCTGSGGTGAWAGLNTDGDVNGDDKFYIRFICN